MPACTYAWAAGKRTFNLCGQCQSPAGAECVPTDGAQECYDGCEFAHGAPARRQLLGDDSGAASSTRVVAVEPPHAVRSVAAYDVVAVAEEGGEVGSAEERLFGGGINPYENDDVWLKVNATLDAATGDIVLDLAPLNGTAPASVRYAWHAVSDSCCVTGDTASDPLLGTTQMPRRGMARP